MTSTTRIIVRATLALALCASATSAQAPVTRAERSEYLETSSYADVLAFVDAVTASPLLHRTTFGYSQLGRPLSLVVAGRGIRSADPGEVRAAGGTRVLVFANIHGGEVEGKEAAQMLLRSIAAGERELWLDSLVVLVAPIYNADGNEAVSVENRTRQHGPLAGVGTRENAQGLDLNRDHMKLESAEARSLARLMTEYDPHVIVDLHTTNGTRHAYHITYAPSLNPATDPGIMRLAREEWLPELTRRLYTATGWHSFHYGNAATPEGGERGWYSFDSRPRFNNNYVGLRNRVALLSEAYSYASFEDRVAVTLAFVEEILDLAAERASGVRAATAAADAADLTDRSLPVRARMRRGPEIEILMGATERRLSPFSGRRYEARLPVVEPVTMRDYSSFEGTETARVPSAYYIPASLTAVLDRLALHGVRTQALAEARTARVARFRIDSTRVAAREFQGHRERALWGEWDAEETTLPVGTVVVPTDQPLGRLAFYLLEPRSDDGLVNWNVLDEALEAEPGAYPILKAAEGAPPAVRVPADAAWAPRRLPVDAEFRGLSAAAGGVAWAAGRNGVFATTSDGGAAWRTGTVEDAESLFLVDAHAVDARTAYLLATHFDGGLARIYRTDDGGRDWDEVFEDARPGAFYDGMAFWDARRGVAFGDAMDGRMAIVRTEDGRRWEPADVIPPALEGEGGFAASGTGIATAGQRHAWIGTGAGSRARVLRTTDAGRTWTAAETPLPAAPTAGIFGIAFRDTLNGVAVGGDYRDTTSAALNVIRTRDGGQTWELVSRSAPDGVRYGVAYVPETEPAMLVSVGPSGSGYSLDDGATWTALDRTGWNTVAFGPDGVGFAAGVRGLVGVMNRP